MLDAVAYKAKLDENKAICKRTTARLMANWRLGQMGKITPEEGVRRAQLILADAKQEYAQLSKELRAL